VHPAEPQELQLLGSQEPGDGGGGGPEQRVALLVTTEQKIHLDSDGQPRGAVPLTAVAGLEKFGRVTLLARTTARRERGSHTRLFDGPVDVRAVGAASSIGGRLRSALNNASFVFRHLRNGSVLIAYVPGVVSLLPVALAILFRRPFAVVVVGDPSEALARDIVPGIAGRVARAVIPYVQRQACLRSDVARFVTETALQRRYPTGVRTETFALSDVVIEDVDDPRRAPDPTEPLRLVTVASLDRPYKGISDLLSAVQIAQGCGRRLRLSVVGDGTLREELEREACRRGVDAIFHGHVSAEQVKGLLRESDVFLLASWTEGQPRALFEAMACGLPVVATAVGGVSDVVSSEYLVPPRHPELLAMALRRLTSNPEKFEEQARRSVEVADSVTAKNNRPKHDAFVRRVAQLATKEGLPAASQVTRVLHIFGAMDVGGAETRTIELMREQSPRGVESHFVTLSGRKGSLAPTIEALGGKVHPLALSPSFAWRFLRLVRQVQPAAIDSHVATFSGALVLLARAAGVPVRITRMHSTGDAHGSSPRRRLQRWAMRQLIHHNSTHIIGVSPAALAEGYRQDWQNDPRCEVIPNGVDVSRLWAASDFDLRQALGASEADVVCLHVGRASPEKNRARIPRVIAAMRERGINARGVLVGPEDPDDESEVRRVARELGVAEWVQVLGERHDIGYLMRAADLVLLTSLREGLPGTVLEAAAVGTPVLSSDVPGAVWISELLDGVECLSLDADDTVWASAAEQLLAYRRPSEEDAKAVFEASPFALSRAVRANLAVYSDRRLR
jgi:glycosyltransferase involved in cell wall biosynthesis